MRDSLLDIKKTKYRYFKDNFKLFPTKTILKFTVPMPREDQTNLFDRDYSEVSITNIEYNRMIEKTAKALVAYGIKKGDVVTICQTNTPETLYMDYALNKIGAIPNYIYPNVTAEEMKYYMEELNSKYMFILDDAAIKKNVESAISGTDIKIISSSVIQSFPEEFKIASVVEGGMVPPAILENEIRWDDFIKAGEKIEHVEENAYVPNSVCSYIHTSGTTSIPKAVIESNENANSIPYNYTKAGIYFDEGKTLVQIIPQFVEFGKVINHMSLCNNLCIAMIPEMDPRNYYDMLRIYKPAYSYSTPSHARELIKKPTDMSNAEMYFFGGDSFDDIEEPLNAYMKENGSRVPAYQGYASSEVSTGALVNRPGAHELGSLGKILGEVEAIIVEPDTFNVIHEPNVVGELCIAGAGVTLGYAGNSEAETNSVFVKHPDGKTYVHMGDLISVNEAGFYSFHGRIKNIIIRKSFKLSPDEIIKAIMEHSKVKQCVVVPKYSKEEGETPSAHIVLNDYTNAEQTLSEIIELVNERVQEFHRPTDYKIREYIPLTRNNKDNITALKIEDTISMYEGVLSSDVVPSFNGEYDFEAIVELDSSLCDISSSDMETRLNEFLSEVTKTFKFKFGKIKFNFIDKTIVYTDADKSVKKSKSYVKHI